MHQTKENQAKPELKEDTKSSVVPLSLEKDFAKILRAPLKKTGAVTF